MLDLILDFIGINLPTIQWSTNYTVSPSTMYQYIVQACCVLAIVLVVSMLNIIFSSIQSISRAR